MVILGTVYGDISAGAKGDTGAFAVALDIKSEEIYVAKEKCTLFTKNAGFLRKVAGAKIIFVGEEGVVCEDITKDFLADIPF